MMSSREGRIPTRTAVLRWRIPVTCIAVALAALIGPAGAMAGSNDTMAGASGPILSGQKYQGAIETSNDVDWWVFYAGDATQLDIALMGLGPDDCFGPEMSLTDANGKIIDQSYSADRNETQHILYTVGAGTFYIEVEPYNIAPCVGSEAIYRLWITASPALLSTPPYIPPAPSSGPSGPSASCRQARARVANLSRRLQHTRSRRQRNRLRARLRHARTQVGQFC